MGEGVAHCLLEYGNGGDAERNPITKLCQATDIMLFSDDYKLQVSIGLFNAVGELIRRWGAITLMLIENLPDFAILLYTT